MPTPTAATTGQLLAWALYDWANSPFFAVIITFVFATYVTEAVAPDPITGTAAWGRALTVSALLIAVSSPILGALADAGGRRKPWLGLATLIGVAGSASLWWIHPEPGDLGLALMLIVIANVALEVGQVFLNAMLPDLAPAGRIGRWSGWSIGLGYLAGIVALLIILLGFIQAEPPPFGLDPGALEQVRATGPFIALWILVFALPLFLFTPDRPRTETATRPTLRRSLADGLRELRTVARREPLVVRFLIARLVYNDGLTTLFAFGGIYAAGTFAMGTAEIIQLGIALNLTAGIGALLLARTDDWLGSKLTILIALGGLMVSGIVALLATDKAVFWAAALLVGGCIGPAQAASRSLMARLSPPERRTEMFGLYALSGKVTAFVGPLLFGGATLLFGTQRAGMATVLLLLGAGALLLTRVPEPRRR
jgi:MFS transporter, UMF1 family